MRIIYEFENTEEYLEFINMNAHASKNEHEQTNNLSIVIDFQFDQEKFGNLCLRLEKKLKHGLHGV